VGRTGSGKSTFLQALFRLVEPLSGDIHIDGINTKTLGLNELRSRIAIIPQEPFCWAGSLRTNVDPFCEYADQEIWYFRFVNHQARLSSCRVENSYKSPPETAGEFCIRGWE
jgi:ABC-type multidrug transport system fused ATPase/permease subunit